MKTKQRGKCPFCGASVEATVIEENTLRRDKCECPSCKESIYLCRSPGCHDYAKGTAVYDHELCPECTETTGRIAGEIGSAALKVGTTVLSAVAIAALAATKKK